MQRRQPVLLKREAQPATLTAGISGSRARFQWYKWVNDVPIAVAVGTNQSLVLSNTTLADSAFYFLVASNSVNTLVSRAALVIVQTDLTGPTLVAADGTMSATNVLVSFSEYITPASATNVANYKITNMT